MSTDQQQSNTAHNNTAHLSLVMPPPNTLIARELLPELERMPPRHDQSAFATALHESDCKYKYLDQVPQPNKKQR